MRLLFMVYLVLIYALVYALGEFVSGRIGLPHSVTFAGLAVFLAAALILYRRRRTKQKWAKMEKIGEKYPEKYVLIRNQRELDGFLKEL